MTCIAVDFDGTLASDEKGFVGISVCGEPIPAMVERVKRWHAAGHEIYIFSARFSNEHNDAIHAKYFVGEWCKKHLGFLPKMSGVKLGCFDVIVDDRAYHVTKNKGEIKEYIPEICGLPDPTGAYVIQKVSGL